MVYKQNWKDGDQGVLKWMNNVSRNLNQAVCSDDYDTLQDAVDAAIGGTPEEALQTTRTAAKPLYITPGQHVLTEPLKIYGVTGLHVYADGAILTSANDMDAVVECAGISLSSISGLSIRCGSGYVAQHGLKVVRDATKAIHHTYGCRFSGINIDGHYVNGIRLGQGSNQCDSLSLNHCNLSGQWQPGITEKWQNGVVIGDGTWGNNLQHHAHSLFATHHRHQVSVQASQFGIFGGGFSYAEAVFYVRTTSFFCASAVRSEGAARLLDCFGAAGYASHVSLRDIDFSADSLAEDGRYVGWGRGGCLIMDNVRVSNTPENIMPTIYARPFVPMSILVRGLSAAGATANEAFDVSENVHVRAEGYTQIANDGGVIAHVPDFGLPSS